MLASYDHGTPLVLEARRGMGLQRGVLTHDEPWQGRLWPPHARSLVADRDAGAGQYGAQGLAMHPEHATHEEGGFGTEAGITEMLSRMQTGRLKVFRNCAAWFVEKRGYHRKNGLIVKERDDLMSATRIGVMMRRFAITRPSKRERRRDRDGGGWMGS